MRLPVLAGRRRDTTAPEATEAVPLDAAAPESGAPESDTPEPAASEPGAAEPGIPEAEADTPEAAELQAARDQQERATDAVRAALQEALAASARHDRLVGALAAANARRLCQRRWRRLARTVLGTGALLGLLALGTLGTVYLLSAPFLVIPPAAALFGVVMVVRRIRAEDVLARTTSAQDLLDAERAVREAQDAVRRARERVWATDRLAQACRARHCAVSRAQERRSTDTATRQAAVEQAQHWVDRYRAVEPGVPG